MQSSHTSPHTHNPYAEFTHLIHHTHRTAKQSAHTSPPHTAQNRYTQFTHITTKGMAFLLQWLMTTHGHTHTHTHTHTHRQTHTHTHSHTHTPPPSSTLDPPVS